MWAAGPLMLLIAGGVAYGFLRGQSTAKGRREAALSAEEEARLKEILKE
ncbi:MAG: hypothetical protein AAFV87_18700 [Pseudomonadota bacterium]